MTLEPAPDSALSGNTILVVDDEVLIRMTLAEDLSDNGYRCLEAASGRDALRLLEENPAIDLLLTDVGLPGGLDGWQVAEAARSGRPGLPVLFITGYADQAAHAGRVAAKGTAVMTKPFRTPELLDKVRELIAG